MIIHPFSCTLSSCPCCVVHTGSRSDAEGGICAFEKKVVYTFTSSGAGSPSVDIYE